MKKKLTSKVAKRIVLLEELFQDRNSKYCGLTKEEFVSVVFNIPKKKVLIMNEKQIRKMWGDICLSRRHLRERKEVAIVCSKVDKGTIITDSKFGKRQLERTTNIYFRLIDESDAYEIRDRYDKIAEGVKRAGEDITKIAKEARQKINLLSKAQEALKILNGKSSK